MKSPSFFDLAPLHVACRAQIYGLKRSDTTCWTFKTIERWSKLPRLQQYKSKHKLWLSVQNQLQNSQTPCIHAYSKTLLHVSQHTHQHTLQFWFLKYILPPIRKVFLLAHKLQAIVMRVKAVAVSSCESNHIRLSSCIRSLELKNWWWNSFLFCHITRRPSPDVFNSSSVQLYLHHWNCYDHVC